MLCKFLLAFVCLSGWAIISAQAQARPDDYLQPVDGYFSSYAHANEYYPQVRKLLFAGLTDNPLARVVVLPSFSPEYVLSIEQKEEDAARHYYLTYRIGQRSIWGALQTKKGPDVAILTSSTELTAGLAKALGVLFNTALLQTRYPIPSDTLSMLMDGTTYTFVTFQSGIGLKSGSTWSPRPASNMGRLVAIIESLPKIAGAGTNQQLQQELLTRILALNEQLNAH